MAKQADTTLCTKPPALIQRGLVNSNNKVVSKLTHLSWWVPDTLVKFLSFQYQKLTIGFQDSTLLSDRPCCIQIISSYHAHHNPCTLTLFDSIWYLIMNNIFNLCKNTTYKPTFKPTNLPRWFLELFIVVFNVKLLLSHYLQKIGKNNLSTLRKNLIINMDPLPSPIMIILISK